MIEWRKSNKPNQTKQPAFPQKSTDKKIHNQFYIFYNAFAVRCSHCARQMDFNLVEVWHSIKKLISFFPKFNVYVNKFEAVIEFLAIPFCSHSIFIFVTINGLYGVCVCFFSSRHQIKFYMDSENMNVITLLYWNWNRMFGCCDDGRSYKYKYKHK